MSKSLDELIELAKQGNDPTLSESEELVEELGLIPGNDLISFNLLTDYFRLKPNRTPRHLAKFLSSRFKKKIRYNRTYYLIDASRLRVSQQEMLNRITKRLYEKRQETQKRSKERWIKQILQQQIKTRVYGL